MFANLSALGANAPEDIVDLLRLMSDVPEDSPEPAPDCMATTKQCQGIAMVLKEDRHDVLMAIFGVDNGHSLTWTQAQTVIEHLNWFTPEVISYCKRVAFSVRQVKGQEVLPGF